MRIQFCGANRAVTGSCHLLEVNGKRILLDVGMFQGPRSESRALNEWLPENASRVDAVILSHGHLDHCGKLPVLTRAGYGGPIYCTRATADVARIVLEDAAQIQVEDAEYLNRRMRNGEQTRVNPIYVPADLKAVFRLIKPVRYGERVQLGNDLAFTFLDAGHILGSAYVIIDWMEKGKPHSLLFTADIGRYGSPILRDPHDLDRSFDHVITESTYGDRDHSDIAQVEQAFLDALKWIMEKRSRMIIPAFAVGRTQNVLWYLHKFACDGLLNGLRIYVDSPMGIEMTRIYQQHTDNYDDHTRDLMKQPAMCGLATVQLTTTAQESRKINSDTGPCVIIASSPTCEFGRVLHHIRQSVEKENDMILFTGFVPQQTLGRRLQERVDRIRIYDTHYDRRCQVRTIHGMSAHADRLEMVRFLAPTLRPTTSAYVVHGEPRSAEAFAALLLERGIGRAIVPARETSMIEI